MKTLKKLFLLLILSLLAQSAFSQDIIKTKQVTENHTTPFPYREVFEVLQTDSITKHGKYEKFKINNNLLCKGNYTFGKKSGIWTYYSNEKSIDYMFDFDNNDILKSSISKEIKSKEITIINKDGKEEKVLADWIAFCKNGKAELNSLIGNMLTYPFEAREKGIEGNVEINVFINEVGIMEVIGISKSVHPILDNESLRVL